MNFYQPTPLLIWTRFLKNPVWKIKLDELDFLSITNLNFAGYTGSKNQVQFNFCDQCSLVSLWKFFIKFCLPGERFMYCSGVLIIKQQVNKEVKICNQYLKRSWVGSWNVCNTMTSINIQGVPSIWKHVRTKFWKLKNPICQKVSPVLKSLNKNLSDDILKPSEIKLEVFLNWIWKNGSNRKNGFAPCPLLTFFTSTP